MTAITRLRIFGPAVTRVWAIGVGAACLWALAAETVLSQQTGPAYSRSPSQPYQFAQNAVPPAAPARPAEPTLLAYPCRPGMAAATAARLQAEFGQVANVRIVADQRTSQILVMAPADLHAQIAGRINAAAAPPAVPNGPRPTAAPVVSPAPAVPEAIRSREIRFQNKRAGEMEAALAETLGDRLSPAASPAAGIRNYRVNLPGGRTLDLAIHLQANLATVRGSGGVVDSCIRLIEALDGPRPAAGESMRTVSLRATDPAVVRRAVEAIRTGGTPGSMVTMLFQQQPPEEEDVVAQPVPENGAPPAGPPPNGQPPGEMQQDRGLIGAVQIDWIEGLDVLVIRGHERDVQQAMSIIQQIEQLSAETVPAVEIYRLRHVDCQAIGALIGPLYDEVFQPRQGTVSITPLVKPNALLLVGRTESVQTVIDLIKRLDLPVAPDTQFRVFRLRHAAAETALTTIVEFFGEDPQEQVGLGPRVLAAADYRSNSLVVRASPRDMVEVAALIERLDTGSSEAVDEIRLFKLQNTLAEELEPILTNAIGAQGAGRGAAGQAGAGATAAEQRSSMLKFVTVDAQGQQRLSSGILTDVRITAEPRVNALLVSAPAESMELIQALIRQLDQLPAAEAQIKVFTIVNGDAGGLMDMLDTLFGQQQGTTTNQPAVRTGAVEGESSLVPLRFAVDTRSNSIIAAGTMGDLQVVEAILLRLDESDVRQRKSTIYRLKNAPAQDVANAINEFLRSERQVQLIEPGLLSAFEQIEREVVVVPEIVSNSLIVSATPRFFEEIADLVEQLDERPPMVMIQVLIAEVELDNTDEFGVELGLQDSILFDRSMLGDLITTTNTEQTSTAEGIVTTTNQIIQAATNTPGFSFNNQTLGNSGSTQALNDSQVVGSQGLSHFAVGRVNDELNFGGLVLSASSESVSILIRALKECRRLEVLARPQVMTLDNQPAYIQVGERVPRITSATISEAGQVNSVTLTDVGLILGVTPRISPDGLVVMEIDAEKSKLGTEAEGIPVTISATGEVVRSPRIKITLAQTTVSAVSGQTIVLGGLITKSKFDVHRKVPGLGDLPLLGSLFRYDAVATERNELLIIMTPHVVRNEGDAEMIKQTETARMNWCLGDVLELQGDDLGMRDRNDDWSDAETSVVYPDMNPSGEWTPVPEDGAEGQPPAGNPFQPEMAPTPADRPTPSDASPAPGGQPTRGARLPGLRPMAGAPRATAPGGQQPGSGPSPGAGGVEQAVYQWQGPPPAPYAQGYGPAAPPMYQQGPHYGQAPYGQPPAAQPVPYGQPPAVQPAAYRQSPVYAPQYAPGSMSQSPQPQTRRY
ncbi:MAG: hypothetical protein JXB62_21270 [Pirellulales bacterium]|nr:hypothetical protein [Pirellulales bacterium]